MTATADPRGLVGPRSAGARVCLLDVVPAFAAAVPADDAEAARALLSLECLELSRGEWTPPEGIGRVLGALVVDGLVVRERVDSGHVAILGPDDVGDVRHLAGGRERWRVLRPTSLALLDARLLVAGRRWPRVFAVLTHRLLDLAEDQAELARILCHPRVEDRLVALLGHYADRWGRITSAGRAVDLPVTHDVLGRLAGAKRPTVTLALGTLAEDGRLIRGENGRWVLPFAPDRERGDAPGE